MAEQLQHLIERIHREAVEKAETQAAQVVSQAKSQAASVVKEAETRAREIVAKAEKDSEVFVERGTRTLEQSARDLLITVGQGIENILQDIIGEAVDQAMDIEVMKKMMLNIAEAYCHQQGRESRIEFLISEKDQAEVVKFFAEQYRQHLLQGITIHTDNGVLKGFRVALKDEQVYHDFTKPAIAEALANFLRQHLSEIVHRAAQEARQA